MIHKNNTADIYTAIQRLSLWVEQNGWSGWGPYDIKGLLLFRKIDSLPNILPIRIFNKIISTLLDVNPLLARKIFRVKPKINAKAMGLFLVSYCNMFSAKAGQSYLQKAQEIAQWLEQNRSTKYQGWGWGYPFDWRSPILIPRGTPSSIASVTIGDGFYLLYKCTGEGKYLSICRQICDFFMKELRVTYNQEGAVCYSYTPLDDYQVHNTNLFVGEFLTRIGKETGDNRLVEQGIRCGNFALKEQQPEGFIPYWGLAQTNQYSYGKIHTDHYHSGFEIRALYGIWKNTLDVRFKKAYEKYFSWYVRNLFEDDIVPKFTPKSMYPIDIHSCSEAILCRAVLLADHPEQLQCLKKTVDWIVKNMEYKEGEYTYQINKLPLIGNRSVNLPMIRWGQAWMFRALSELYRKVN